MAHLLEMQNGEGQMFSVKQKPWHGLGRVIEEAPSIEEGIKIAGLDWKVEIHQVSYGKGDTTAATKEYNALVRSDNGKLLSIMKKSYHPLQNSEAFQFFNPFVEQKQASLETAGSLRDGKTIWVLAKLNRDPIEVVKNDPVEKFLLLSNSHDGSMAVRVGFTPIRVVCNNTLTMAHNQSEIQKNAPSQLLRVFHSRNVVQNLDKVSQIINAADAKFEATAEQYKALARKQVSKKELARFVEIVFKFSAVEVEEKRIKAKERLMMDLSRLFESGRGNSMPGVKGTAWALYNSATEYLTHERGKDDHRLNQLWFGEAARINSAALAEALKIAA